MRVDKNKKQEKTGGGGRSVFFFSFYSPHSGDVLRAGAALLERGRRRGRRSGPLGGVGRSPSSAVAVPSSSAVVFGGSGSGSSGSGSGSSVAAPSVSLRRRALKPRVPQGLGGRRTALRVVLEHRHQEVGERRGLVFLFIINWLTFRGEFLCFRRRWKEENTSSLLGLYFSGSSPNSSNALPREEEERQREGSTV